MLVAAALAGLQLALLIGGLPGILYGVAGAAALLPVLIGAPILVRLVVRALRPRH